MRIDQIISKITCGEAYVGKWFCSDYVIAPDKEAVHRYLQHDGTWGKNTEYFDTKEQIEELLKLGHKSDFHCDRQEMYDRQTMREDCEASFYRDDESFLQYEEVDY